MEKFKINEFEKRLLSSIIILPIILFLIIEGSIFFTVLLSILFILGSYEWIKMIKHSYLTKIIGVFFLTFSFYSAYELRIFAGLHFFLLIILICITSDIGGYIIGKIFKGPRLTKISPNKTYSGSLGSFIFPVIAAFIYNKYTIIPTNNNLPNHLIELTDNYNSGFLLFVLFISLISQIGDLIISYFKRKNNIKNTGKILPGHGGILDRIDGLIFVIPISYSFIVL